MIENYVTVLLLLYVMMGQNHRKKMLRCVCIKRGANGAIVFITILSNLALGHEIDRHFWRGVELK